MNENSMLIFINTVTVAVGTMLSYLGLNNEVMALYCALLALDFMTGVIKASVVKEEVTASRMKSGLLAKISMLVLPVTLAIVAKIVGVEAEDLFKWGIALLAVSEGYSVYCNVYTINTGEKLPRLDAIAIIGNKLREFIEKVFKGFL